MLHRCNFVHAPFALSSRRNQEPDGKIAQHPFTCAKGQRTAPKLSNSFVQFRGSQGNGEVALGLLFYKIIRLASRATGGFHGDTIGKRAAQQRDFSSVFKTIHRHRYSFGVSRHVKAALGRVGERVCW